MTEKQKKTLGMAIASLVLGCLFIIPLLGFLFSLLAIIFGIVAMIKINKNKEDLKGEGLAISGIVLGALGFILIPIIALLSAIAIPNFLRARLNANQSSAQASIQQIASAAESFSTENQRYPSNLSELSGDIDEGLLDGIDKGYNFIYTPDSDGYMLKASPEKPNLSGEKVFIIEDGGQLQVEELNRNYRD